MMKSLTKIIESVIAENYNNSPIAKQDRKINNIQHPTDQARSHTFRGPRLGGIKTDGSLGKVSRIRKDRSGAYIGSHPTLNPSIKNAQRKLISPIKAKQLLDPKVDLNKVIKNKKQKTWQISNSQTRVIFEPGVGPAGSFFVVN